MSKYAFPIKVKEIIRIPEPTLSLKLLLAAFIAIGVFGLISCSSEFREDPVNTGFFPAPGDSETIILPDGTTFKITFDGVTDRTWCYTIEWISGKDLSHWVLGIECHIEEDPGSGHVEDSGGGSITNPDSTTGVVGIKWETSGDGSGTYCITMDDYYEETTVTVAFKAGNQYATGGIPGPSCQRMIIHDQGGMTSR